MIRSPVRAVVAQQCDVSGGATWKSKHNGPSFRKLHPTTIQPLLIEIINNPSIDLCLLGIHSFIATQ